MVHDLLHDQNDTGGIEQLLPPYTCSNMFGTSTSCLGLMQTAEYHGADALQIVKTKAGQPSG